MSSSMRWRSGVIIGSSGEVGTPPNEPRGCSGSAVVTVNDDTSIALRGQDVHGFTESAKNPVRGCMTTPLCRTWSDALGRQAQPRRDPGEHRFNPARRLEPAVPL